MTLELRGVSKVFHDRRRGSGVVALRDVDLEVRENEFLVIIGPSGCGKSTIINLIAGFERPTRGQVLLDDKEIEGPSPNRGVVFQDHSLFPWMTTRENIEFGLGSNGMTPSQRKEVSTHYLELVGLLDFQDSRPSELSGGMRQKLAVARTMALDPEILLMDEPFGSLDEETRRRMDAELLNVWKRDKKTVIFVTHNLEEAVMLGDRVILMSSRPGTVVREWQVSKEHPRNPMAPCICEIKREISSQLTNAWGENGNGVPVSSGKDEEGTLERLAPLSRASLLGRRLL